MITEDYVSFEVAKLLKEKGFNEECDVAYSKINGEYLLNDVVDDYGYGSTNSYLECKNEMSAPTLQMAMKWLRTKKLIILIGVSKNNYYNAKILDTRSNGYVKIGGYDAYEEAEEEAIKYCLTTLID